VEGVSALCSHTIVELLRRETQDFIITFHITEYEAMSTKYEVMFKAVEVDHKERDKIRGDVESESENVIEVSQN